MMLSNVLSPSHILKLGHEIEEIRSRALGCINSKYCLGLVDETNFNNTKHLFKSLLKWFDFEDHSDDATALKLIHRITQGEHFSMVVEEVGADNIFKQIGRIEQITDPSLLPVISDIKDKTLNASRKYNAVHNSNHIPAESVAPNKNLENVASPSVRDSPTVEILKGHVKTCSTHQPLQFFPWQTLITSDRQVLMAIYEGLRYIDNNASILESSHFFKDVVLRDFPSEVFLQRPLIFQTFLELLKSSHEENRLPILHCLAELTVFLVARVRAMNLRHFRGLRWKCEDFSVAELSTEEGDRTEHEHCQFSVSDFGESILAQCVNGGKGCIEEVNLCVTMIRNVQHLFFLTDNDPKKIFAILQRALTEPWPKMPFWSLVTCSVHWALNWNDLALTTRQMMCENIGLPSLVLFYPNLHSEFISILSTLGEREFLNDIEECINICSAMEAADDCLKLKTNYGSKLEYLRKLDQSLCSLEFHKNYKLVHDFMRFCRHRDLTECEGFMRKNILLKLLSYPDSEIQLVVYRGIHKNVKKFTDVADVTDGLADKLEFLYEEDIWKEFLRHALNSTAQLSELCQESITLILKSKPMTSASVWCNLCKSLVPCLDLLSIYADNSVPFGQCIARFFDPDIAAAFSLGPGEVLRGNLRLLFNKDFSVNQTAFSRLCWILDSVPDSAQKHLKMNIIRGLDLSSICVINERNENIAYTSISTPRSLEEVLAVLRNESSEPKTRKLALVRLEVITKDVSLHRMFMEEGGLELLVSAMDSALTEADERYLPDSVVFIIAILVNVARRESAVRMELAGKDYVLLNVVRSLLLFNGDEPFRENAVELLFLLLFGNQIKRVNAEQPLRCQLSVSAALSQRLHLPFMAQTHATVSPHVIASRKVLIMGNANLSRLLRVYWAALSLGNISTVLPLEESDLQQDNFSPGLPADLRLTPADLRDLQSGSLVHVIRGHLVSIQKATSHNDVLESIHQLNSCLTWLEIYKTLPVSSTPSFRIMFAHNQDIHCLPWMSTFERFLAVPPASVEDEKLLNQLLYLVNRLLKIMDSEDMVDWVSTLLTRPANILSKLLKQIGDSGYGIEGRELRQTVTELAHRILYTLPADAPSVAWLEILKLILGYLQNTSVGQPCSVAPIDWILGLLADITALNWKFKDELDLYEDLVTAVVDILLMFNGFTEPKGSFLCTNIVGNALISLTNLLSDGAMSIQNYENVWERVLQKLSADSPEDVDFHWMLSLTNHGDPQVRACALSLISGFFASTESYEVLVRRLALEVDVVWAFGLTILLDRQECALVREKAADLLARMTALGSSNSCADFTAITTDNFFEALTAIITSLGETESSNAVDVGVSVTTPALVSAVYKLLLAVCLLNPGKGCQQVAETGMLYHAVICLGVDEEMDEERLDMVVAGMKLLRTCTLHSPEAVRLVSTSPECCRAVLFYLNPKLHESLPTTLIYSLWTEAFNLLSTILVKTETGYILFAQTVESSREEFLGALMHGLQSSADLKDSARTLLANIAGHDHAHLLTAEVPSGNSLAINACSVFLGDLYSSADALANLFMSSKEAQIFALTQGLVEVTIMEMKKIVLKLKSDNVDNLRKAAGKRKIDPLLESLLSFCRLTMHFCYQNHLVKKRLADCGLADVVHRLWLWYGHRPALLNMVLKMLCTFTQQSERASQSLALTSSPAGLRKSPGAVTLIHSLIQLVGTEMDQFSQVKGSLRLGLTLEILSNSCSALECRVVLSKGLVLSRFTKIVASLTKKRQYGEQVLELWLEFLAAFTAHPEGQTTVCENVDAMEFIFTMAASTNPLHRKYALTTLNQIAINPLNRVRLLAKPANLLAVILLLIQTQPEDDVRLAASILWSLAANSQKGKLLLRSAGCVEALEEVRQRCATKECAEVVQRAVHVLNNK